MNIHNCQSIMMQGMSQYVEDTEYGYSDFGELGHTYFLFIKTPESNMTDEISSVIYDGLYVENS